jgi:hypothetical protein
MGVRRIEDPHHPRGYRELRSNGEMRKLLDRKIVSVRATHPVLASRLVLHWSYERSGSDAQAT